MSTETVWQIGAGETGRRYDNLFLEHDVMFCGPSEFGPFDETAYQQGISSGYTSNKIGQVRAFATHVNPGDIILARSGYRVVSIGVVAGDGYRHNPIFDDIYGWDVEHTHRVIWQPQLEDELNGIQSKRDLFADRKQVPTFTSVGDPKIIDPIKHLFSKIDSGRPLKELPATPSAPLSLNQLGEALFAKGLGYEAVDRVRAAIQKQRRLLNWYWSSGLATDRPTEHEIVAHVVLPLLLALGWSEQLLAIEWHKIDLAAFWSTPTDAQHCKLICEAKTLGHGLQNVLGQAQGYIEKRSLKECDKILLADGGRFYLYRRVSGEWGDTPWGYVNVFKIRENHVCPKNTNAVETLVALTPSNVAR